MTRTRVSAFLFVVASSLAGCMGTGNVEYAGEVRVTSPELVEISPGVQVIADADEPIFFAQGDYWLYRDGYWFRSRDYRRGYARVEFTYVPTQVRVIEQPQRYVHYRKNLGRHHHARTPQVRQRSTQPTYQPPVQQQQPTYPAQPAVPAQPAQPAVPAQPTYPAQQQPLPPRPTYPGQPTQPTSPALPSTTHPSDTHAPHHPPGQQPGGANPTQPTTPPGPNAPVQTPNDNRREPPPQRNAPADVDRTSPGKSGSAPGQANRPQDRGPSAAPAPQGPATPPATARPADRPPASQTREQDNPQDRADRATPPGQNKTDDRTKKVDEQKDKKDKRDK